MIIQFRVKNFLSFKEDTIIYFKGHPKIRKKSCRTANAKGFRILPVAAIFGRNGAGKTNLIKAIEFIKYFVVEREMITCNGLNLTTPEIAFKTKEKFFRELAELSAGKITLDLSKKDKTEFEIDFLISKGGKDKIYTLYLECAGYNFYISKEKLSRLKTDGKEKIIYHIEKNKVIHIDKSLYKTAKEYNALTWFVENNRNSQMLLQAFKQKDCVLNEVHEYFKNIIIVKDCYANNLDTPIEDLIYKINLALFNLDNDNQEVLVKECVRDEYNEDVVDGLMKTQPYRNFIYYSKDRINIGYFNSTVTRFSVKAKILGVAMKKITHQTHQASKGEKRLVQILAALVEAREQNKVVIIDDIDENLNNHVIRDVLFRFLFDYEKEDRYQIIFTTHDDNLLQDGLLRYDEKYLIRKENGESSLTCVAEYEDVRKKFSL